MVFVLINIKKLTTGRDFHKVILGKKVVNKDGSSKLVNHLTGKTITQFIGVSDQLPNGSANTFPKYMSQA